MTTKHEVPRIWVVPESRMASHRQLRAQRHQQVRGLLRRTPWWSHFEWPIYAFCLVVIALVSLVAGVAAAIFFAVKFDGALRAIFGS